MRPPQEQPDIVVTHSKVCHICREDEEWRKIAEWWDGSASDPEDGEVAERVCDECGEQLRWFWFVRIAVDVDLLDELGRQLAVASLDLLKVSTVRSGEVFEHDRADLLGALDRYAEEMAEPPRVVERAISGLGA